MKKGLSLLVGLVMAVFFISASPVVAKELHFAVCLPTLDQPHFVAQRYGYEDEAKKLGIKVTVYDAGGYPNLARQIQQMEDAIAKKVDALILVATNAAGTVPAVDEVVKAGIPVINVNAMSDSQKIIGRVRSDDIEIGHMAGEYLAEKFKHKGNIIMLPGKAGVSPIMLRAQGVKEVMKKYPQMKILAEQYSEMTRAEGMRLMEDMLQAHGKDIQGVYAVGEHLGMGAARALQAAKRTGVVICAVDFSKDLEQAIRDGWISATVSQQTITMGRMGVRLAKDVVEGKKIPPISFTPITMITKENIDTVDRSGFQMPAK